MVTLKYKDDKDRAYGLGGMTVCMLLMDNEGFIDSVNLDAPADCGMVFSPDFYYVDNPNLSAKAVWRKKSTQFETVAGMLISNLLARALVREQSEISRELSDLLLSNLKDEGREACSLEEDEVRDVFYKTYSFFHRVFSHRQVGAIMDEFVDKLIKVRRMDRESVITVFGRLINR